MNCNLFLISLEINNVFFVVLILMSTNMFVLVSESLSRQSETSLQLWFAFTQDSFRAAAKNQLRLHFILHYFLIISSEVSWKEICNLVLFIEKIERYFSQSTIDE